MRPLIAEDEATLRAIAERHGFYAPRGPHTGEGSASRLIDALLTGEVVTLALTPPDRRRLARRGVAPRGTPGDGPAKPGRATAAHPPQNGQGHDPACLDHHQGDDTTQSTSRPPHDR